MTEFCSSKDPGVDHMFPVLLKAYRGEPQFGTQMPESWNLALSCFVLNQVNEKGEKSYFLFWNFPMYLLFSLSVNGILGISSWDKLGEPSISLRLLKYSSSACFWEAEDSVVKNLSSTTRSLGFKPCLCHPPTVQSSSKFLKLSGLQFPLQCR